MRQKKMSALVAAVLMAVSLTACSGNAEYPSKEITMIVPFGSGGSTDLLARTMAETAGESIGETMVVSNVTGASGTVGSAQLADADADGYNLMFVTSAPITIQPYFMEGLTYTYEDFDYICNVATEPTCIAVLADSPYQTLEDLVAAGQSGTEITFGNTGVGTLHYIFQEQFCKAAGIEYKQVGFEGGAKLVTGLLGNNVDAISTVVSEMYDYVDSGEIRILAVSTEERSAIYPDIPTVKESGYDLSMSLDFFLVAPKGLDDEVKEKISSVFAETAQSETVVSFLNNSHVEANYMDGETLAEKVKADSEMYQEMLSASE